MVLAAWKKMPSHTINNSYVDVHVVALPIVVTGRKNEHIISRLVDQ